MVSIGLRTKSRAWVVPAACLVVILALALAGLYYAVTAPGPPGPLPLFVGTVFTRQTALDWLAYANVSSAGWTLEGAWTAFNASGTPFLVVVNGTLLYNPGRYVSCPIPRTRPWAEVRGSLDEPIGPGPHTLFWSPCVRFSNLVITATLQITRAVSLGR